MTIRLRSRRNARLGVEPLERRDLMAADDFRQSLLPTESASIYGPLPLEPTGTAPAQVVSPTTNPPMPSPPSGGEEDPHARFGQGNITVAVINGVLVIRGDGGNNRVNIYSSTVGSYTIDAGWTKINGQYYVGSELNTRYLFVQGVTAGFDIDMGEGNDYLLIHAGKVPSLTIRMGAGDDHLALKGPVPMPMFLTMVYYPYPVQSGPTIGWDRPAQPLQVDGDLFIDTGAGNDQLNPYAAVAGDATVRMGAGDDIYLEAPSEIHPILDFVDPLTDYYQPRLRVLGKLTATGEISIDLGADQELENIPDDWRTDQYLVEHIQIIPSVLDFYAGMVERGENTPGVAQIVTPPWPNNIPVRFDEAGRLEIYFQFLPGFTRVIERLQARGVTLDAYSIMRGFARASITADDLKLFANLPGISNYFVQIYANPGYRSQIHPEWDYVRPGSAAAAENPPGPVEGNIVGPDYVPPGKGDFPITHPLPIIIGPPRYEDLPASEQESLLDSRNGKRFQTDQGTSIFGPQPIK